MARKELSPPDENRRRASKLFDDGDGEKNSNERTRKPDSDDFTGESDEEILDFEETKKTSRTKTARQYAMYLVSVKAYTERDLRRKLKDKGYTAFDADEALEYVKSFGYINDLRLAQAAAERLASQLKGKRKIFFYLASKGVSRSIIDELDLSELDFKGNCRILAEKKSRMGKSREQIMRVLQSAGFSGSEITYALSDLESE